MCPAGDHAFAYHGHGGCYSLAHSNGRCRATHFHATTDCGHTGLLFRSQFPSAVGGPLVAYHAYLPPCYGQDGRTYPTLILLHGSIQNDSHWADLGLAQYAEADLSRMRIWLDWGQADFLRNGSQALADALSQAGIPIDVHIFGGGHNDRYWQLHLRDYLDWHTAVWPPDRGSYPPC